jgi:maleate isomerase
MEDSDMDALFISCTNLRALDAIAPLEARLGKPVLTSNQVLGWHMMQSAGAAFPDSAPGLLFRS